MLREIAIAAAETGDWKKTNQSLQQIFKASETRGDTLTEAEWETVSNLALQVLRRGDFQEQWEVAALFPQLGKRAIAPLIALLEDETADLDSRWFAGRILSQFDDPTSILSFAKLLQVTSADEDLALMAAQSLAQRGEAAVAVLRDILPRSESRLLAVQALAQIRQVETIPLLIQVVGDPEPAIRVIAVEALGSFHDPRSLPVLLAALSDPAPAVRREAIAALSYRHQEELPTDFASQLQAHLYDHDPTVCQQAAIALGRRGTEEAIAALFLALQSSTTSLSLKRQIVFALSWSETAAALNYLQAGLHGSDPATCQEIIAGLGRQTLPALKVRATEILQDFLPTSPYPLPSLQQAIATALGQLGQPSAVAPLQQLAATSDRRVRLHAIAALKKLEDSAVVLNADLTRGGDGVMGWGEQAKD